MVHARGIAQVKLIEEFDIALQNELSFKNAKEGADFVSVMLVEKGEFLRTVGIEELVYETCIVHIRDRQICSVQATYTPKSLADFSNAWQTVIHWAGDHAPQQMPSLMPEGKFKYDLSSGVVWLDFAQQWRSAQKLQR